MDARFHAERVLSVIGDLSSADALLVLNTAMGRLLSTIDQDPAHTNKQAVSPLIANLMHRRSGSRSRLDTDHELVAFIQGLPEEFTYQQIEAACRDRFGRHRAPSKSAIQRYVKRLNIQLKEEQKEGGNSE